MKIHYCDAGDKQIEPNMVIIILWLDSTEPYRALPFIIYIFNYC